jgi:hypothetical protein
LPSVGWIGVNIRLPTRSCGLDVVPLENALDRVAVDLMVEVAQRANQPRLHPDDQRLQVAGRRAPAVELDDRGGVGWHTRGIQRGDIEVSGLRSRSSGSSS